MAARVQDGTYLAVVNYGHEAGDLSGRQLVVDLDGTATLDGRRIDGATALYLLARAYARNVSPAGPQVRVAIALSFSDAR